MNAAIPVINDEQLAAGTWPAVQFFKSAAFFLEPDETGDDFVVSSTILADWVIRFDHWFKQTAGILTGERLHLVYHREVAIVGDLPIAQTDALLRIGQACRTVGIGFSVTLDLPQALAEPERLATLVESGIVSSIGVRQLDEEERAPDGNDAREVVDGLLGRGMQVGLIGPVSYWKRAGVLASPVLNRANMTLYPRGPRNLEQLPFPQTPVAPCFGRFRLYVDAEGVVYPCLGLLGLRSASLGTVFDDFDETGLGRKPGPLDLARLARRGPTNLGPSLARGDRKSALPPICERHRFQLEQEVSGGSGHEARQSS